LDDELLEAAENGDLIKVQTLLENGANPNAKDNAGRTPLHIAALWGRVEIVKLLLERDVNPNAKDNYGDTPLHIAALWGHVEIVKILLERGADPNAKDNDEHIPLDYAEDNAIRSLLKSSMRVYLRVP
jgi:ankyrin repeat protein